MSAPASPVSTGPKSMPAAAIGRKVKLTRISALMKIVNWLSSTDSAMSIEVPVSERTLRISRADSAVRRGIPRSSAAREENRFIKKITSFHVTVSCYMKRGLALWMQQRDAGPAPQGFLFVRPTTPRSGGT